MAKIIKFPDNRTIYVDLYDPEPYIETSNNSWFNTPNPLIYFNITDNINIIATSQVKYL